nr:MAG TPA: hypothetical protein [Bacteriophage sp.]
MMIGIMTQYLVIQIMNIVQNDSSLSRCMK